MDKALDQLVRSRAGERCEYCHLPALLSDLGHVIDHIRARQHRGVTTAENLALACGRCNLSKGPNVAGFDPESDVVTRLFNPRLDRWDEHFRWEGPVLKGFPAVIHHMPGREAGTGPGGHAGRERFEVRRYLYL